MSMPSGWKIRELRDLVEIDPELLSESTVKNYSFHYIDIASVSESKINVNPYTITFKDAPSRARKVLRSHDVLMSTVRPNLRAFAHYNHEYDDCVASTGFAVLRAVKFVDPRFVLYAILSESVTRQIEAHVSGSNYPAIKTSAVGQLKILTPPSAEQTKIAEVLSTVDRAIEQTEDLIAKQQRIKTGLMQDLLTRGIDADGNLRSEATHAFKDSPLGRIPVEWEVTELGALTTKIADRDHSTPKYVPDGVLMISPMAFCDDEGINFEICPRISREAHERNSKKTDSRPGDLIIHRIGAGLGRIRMVETGHPEYSLLHSLALIRANYDIADADFLKWSIRALYVQLQMGIGTQSIGVPDLGLEKIASFLIKHPKQVEEQTKISKTIDKLAIDIRMARSQYAKLRSLKSALMQDLLTGEVRVTPLLT